MIHEEKDIIISLCLQGEKCRSCWPGLFKLQPACATLAPTAVKQSPFWESGQLDGRLVFEDCGGPGPQFVIVDNDRHVVSTYYRDEFSRGNCPPGLAKKDNGCLPPGQAKKMWVVGQPLPPQVVYYQLPPTLYRQLTPPPYGYEYVRVDDDVLLMQSATRSILNILTNLR